MDLLTLLAAVVALIVAMQVRTRVAGLESKLKSTVEALQRAVGEIAILRGVPLQDLPSPGLAPATRAPAAAVAPASPTAVPAAGGAAVNATAPAAASAPAGPSLEERLGTRWAVWVGGLALAAGGLLLVKYSIEQGVFGPGVRVMLGALFSALLVGAGEWLRRGATRVDFAAIPAAHIPSVLTAAGTMAAFATIYAAHALYGFIGPAGAFVLLGLAAIATMFAAALHGPALAGLGLAGALVTPALVAPVQTPSPWPLVLYLAVVAAAAFWLARARRWLWLASAVVAGAVVWGILMSVDTAGNADWHLARFVHAIVQLALAAGFMALEPHIAARDDQSRPDWIATAALAALALLTVHVLGATPFAATGWLICAIAAMAILAATGVRVAPAAAATVLAGLVAVAVALLWPGLKAAPESRLLWPAVGELMRLPELVQSYLTFTAAATLAIAAAATWRLWQGRALLPATAGLYALAAVVTPLAVLVVVYLRMTQFDRSIPYAGIAVLLAGLLYLAADRFDNVPADQKSPFTRFCIAVYAAGCTAAMALAFSFALERGYLTVAFAVAAATTALFAVIDKIASLRWMAAALGILVLGRLAWDPRIAGADVGTLPVFNWLLLGYGAPAAAFLFAGHTLRRDKDDLPARLCDALGVLFAFLLVFFEIRHWLNGGDIRAPISNHVEQGLFALMAFGGAYVLNRLDLARKNAVFAWATLLAGGLAAVFAVGGLMLAENPLLNSDLVAGPAVFSSLFVGYLLPGAAAVLLARSARGVRPLWYVTGAAMLALLLIFAYVTLETRHVFQGPRIGLLRATTSAEMWAYSAVWLALGLACLAYGLVRGSVEARIASALLVVAAAVKVFLFDAAGVSGIWRPLSFICLGAVLIGIGLVYQRLIFAKPAAASAVAT